MHLTRFMYFMLFLLGWLTYFILNLPMSTAETSSAEKAKMPVECRDHASDQMLKTYSTPINNIITESRLDIIFNTHMLQMVPGECAYNKYNPLVLIDVEMPQAYSMFIIHLRRQKEILHILEQLHPINNKIFLPVKKSSYLSAKKKQILTRASDLQRIKDQLFHYIEDKPMPLFDIKNIILIFTTVHKGNLMRQYSDTYNTINTFKEYISTYKSELNHAYQNILVEYSEEGYAQRAQNVTTPSPMVMQSMNANALLSYKKNVFNRNNLIFEYLLMSIYMKVESILYFVNTDPTVLYLKNHGVKISGLDALKKKAQQFQDKYTQCKRNYYTLVRKIPSIKTFWKNVYTLYKNYTNVLINTNLALEDVVLSIDKTAAFDNPGYGATHHRIISLLSSLNFLAEHAHRKLSTKIIASKVLEDSQGSLQSPERLKNPSLDDSLSDSTVMRLSNFSRALDARIESNTISQQDVRDAGLVISAINAKVHYEGRHGNETQKENTQVYINRYGFQNPSKYIECYNEVAKKISEEIRNSPGMCAETNLMDDFSSMLMYKRKNPANKEEEIIQNENLFSAYFNLFMNALFKSRQAIDDQQKCKAIKPNLLKTLLDVMAVCYKVAVTENVQDIPSTLALAVDGFPIQASSAELHVNATTFYVIDTLMAGIKNETGMHDLDFYALFRNAISELNIKKEARDNSHAIHQNRTEKISDYLYKSHGMSIINAISTIRASLEHEAKVLGLEWGDAPETDTRLLSNRMHKSYFDLLNQNKNAIIKLLQTVFDKETQIGNMNRDCTLKLAELYNKISTTLSTMHNVDMKKELDAILKSVDKSMLENNPIKVQVSAVPEANTNNNPLSLGTV
ncbi:uncharacterized protein NEMAJ01_1489 [Nematocida major]|uniref:uncharacterized protein n=1 Tax=Nematocida major TaxID=1912982 RepID=UPI0020078172|nr:uncharacterized protein NEMAJ01_1489 [Nematocida major]KAH9386593.1 hypothetical protein NEMAJ01_1489 [Nematocida major]